MRQWAICVGINQYQFFQPLSYAQQDAQSIQRFLVEDAGIPPEQCILLTETSSSLQGEPTVPTRDVILHWVNQLTQGLIQPEDGLWFFFSGYGVCQQGVDYLVPIEGKPTALASTALPIETILRSLAQGPTKNVLVLLDMSRNGGSLSYETVGRQTAQLAEQMGISAILSCQPGQFSRETSALGHGFFTAALLESLQQRHDTSLAAVERYLSDRLPELNEHYWRPAQQPLVTQVAGQDYLILPSPPGRATATIRPDAPTGNGHHNDNGFSKAPSRPLPVGTAAPDSTAQPVAYRNGHGSDHGGNSRSSPNLPTQSTVAVNGAGIDATQPPAARSAQPAVSGNAPNSASYLGSPPQSTHVQSIDTHGQTNKNGLAQPAQATPMTQPDPLNPHLIEDPDEIPDALFWRPILLWGGIAVVALILGVLLRNSRAFSPTHSHTQSALPAANQPSGSGNSVSGTTPAISQSTGLASGAAPASIAAVPAQTMTTTQPLGASGTNQLSTAANAAAPSKSGQPAIAVPSSAAKSSPTGTVAAAIPPQGVAKTPQAPVKSPLALARAKVAVNSEQASPYSDAIQLAKTVPQGQPDYAQAQQAIADWSHKILQIARLRERQRVYDAAIMAASLVPQEQTIDYKDAKKMKAQWCPLFQRQKNLNWAQRQAKGACQQ